MSSGRFSGTTEFVVHRTAASSSVVVAPQQVRQQASKLSYLRSLICPENAGLRITTLDLTNAFNSPEFRDKSVREQAFKALATFIKNNRSLRELCLDNNTIYKEEANLLAEALATSPLQKLRLRNCLFEKPYSVTAIIDALKDSAEFRRISLEGSIEPDRSISFGREIIEKYKSIQDKIGLDLKTCAVVVKIMQQHALISQRFSKTLSERNMMAASRVSHEPERKERKEKKAEVKAEEAPKKEFKKEEELPSESHFVYFTKREKRIIFSGVVDSGWPKRLGKG